MSRTPWSGTPGCSARVPWIRTRASRSSSTSPAPITSPVRFTPAWSERLSFSRSHEQHSESGPCRCGYSWDLLNDNRSEEHTSELQSRFDLVCRLLLEKKKVDEDAGKDRKSTRLN